MQLDKVNWGFIGCGEVTEKKKRPRFQHDRRLTRSCRNEPR